MDKVRSDEYLAQINNLLYIYNKETNSNKKIVDNKDLQLVTKDYFTDQELQGFKPFYSPSFLKSLNLLRERYGKPIEVSTAIGAAGRHLGKYSQSMHNIDYYGIVRAVDVFPGITKIKEAVLFTNIAIACDFKGIGVYPRFHPTWGFHLDDRLNKETWVDNAAYPAHNYVYGDLEEVLVKLGFK